ncbi:MAG: sugar kinase, partial [Eubacteriales bacterium]|nr:sugar kinase [Eubacteriales bacterium]
MKKIIGFGDMLVSLNPPGYQRFIQAEMMEVNYTGAEANVLVSLSMMGLKTELVTRLPENAVSRCAVSCMNRFGVGTDHIAYGGERIGVIYTERGASQRPSVVVYDRKGTAICEAKP